MRKKIIIDNKVIGDGQKSFIIAEIGLNHNNDIELAKKMIDSAKSHGADAVKFQTYITEKLFSDKMEIFPLIKSLELNKGQFKEISEYCKKSGITFFSTPLCTESVEWLRELDVPAYKIASSDLDFFEMIKACAKTGKPVILSTGMSDLRLIKNAVKTIEKTGNKNIVILHTITKYPPEYKDMDLRMIEIMQKTFNYPIGFSDHSLDNLSSISARVLGASVFEKHFTLDKKLPGPDHTISLEPQDLLDLRNKLNAIDETLLPHKNGRSDMIFEKGAKRGLYAAVDIKAGSRITREMISVIRPKSVLSPIDLSIVIGKKAKKDIKSESPFDLSCI